MKKNSGILFFFLSIFVSAFLIFKPALATDSAGLLPPGVQQFFDNNGNPLSSGKVYFYDVGTTTFKDIYTSSAATTTYTNPITLNAGGKPPGGSGIYGIGLYRQLVKDKNGNTIWDAVTSPSGSGGSTPTDVGDGNLVGTILPWSGLVAPNQYVFAYGQEISRSAYPELYTAITLQSNVICSATSNVLTGLADTSQIAIGTPVELSLCVISGTTVISKTSSSVTLSNPSSVSINAVATFFPFGNGDGSNTFNVPDLRGYTLVGRTNMGGTTSTNLTAYFSNTISPNALGAKGGSQSHTQTIAEMPAHDHGGATGSNTAGITTTNITSANNDGGRLVGFLDTMLFGGGTSRGNTEAHTHTIASQGGGNPFTIVQPSITMNYIIKVTPDTSTSIATGVYSIGGMSGVISCGTGILCTGNIISWNGNSVAGGSTGSVQYRNSDGSFGGSPNLIFTSPDTLTFGAAGITANFDLYGSTSGRIRQTAPAVAGTTNIVWGNSSGTPAVTASSPVVLNSTTGNLTCPTCLTGSGGAITGTSPIVISGNNVSITGQALTRTNDTNVTLTLGGAASTSLVSAASLTLGWTGSLAETRGGTNQTTYITGDTLYASAANTLSKLAGNTTTTRKFYRQTGTGTVSAAPAWDTITNADIPGAAFTASNDTNVTATLTGSPTTAVLTPMTFTLGWTGQLGLTRGGTGTSTITANQLVIGGASALSTISCATTTTVLHGGTPPTCSQIVSSDITTNTISDDRLVQAAAATIKGNPTSSTANIQAFTLGGLTQTVSPGSLDWMLIYDNSTNTFKKINAASIASSSVAGVATLNGLSGALSLSNGQAIQAIGASGSTITISADVASAAQFEAGTANKLLDASTVFTSETTTTYGATTAFDFSTFINTKVTLTGNITTMNCSNMKAGQAGTIAFIQDGTGSRTAAFSSGTCSTTLKFAGATYPTLTTSASAVDILSYSCRSTSYCAAALSKGYNP